MPIHVTADGVRLHYELTGTGPAVAFVNGPFYPSTAWGRAVRALEGAATVLTYDLRNQGRSSHGDASFERHVTDVVSLLDALEWRGAILVGHSIGTAVCAAVAAARDDLVRALVLVAPQVDPRGYARRMHWMRVWNDAAERGGAEALFDVIWPLSYSDRLINRLGDTGYRLFRSRFVASRCAETCRLFGADALRHGLPSRLGEVTAPTLVIAGAEDALTSAGSIEETVRRLPDAATTTFPYVGHTPFLEAPDEFHRELLAFLRRCEPCRT